MALDKQGTGLLVLRLMIGIFFVFEGLGKLRWFTDTSILRGVSRIGANRRPPVR